MARRAQLVAPSLPANYCLTDLQAFVNYIFHKGYASLPDENDLFVISETEPAAADRDKIWFRIVDDAPDRWYKFFNGEWVCPHEVPPSGSERRMWVGNEQSLTTYDGGDTEALGDDSGPMWEVDDDFAAKFPLFAGTLPSGTVILPGSTGGAETVTLTTAQIPTHTHIFTGKGATGAGGDGGAAWVGDGADQVTEETGGGEAHTNMPPYRGLYLIKRTSRIYRKV